MAARGNEHAGAPILVDRPHASAATEFGAVLAQTAMTAAGLARLLRAHGWRVSDRAARAWAAGEAGRRPPPAVLLEWLRSLAGHVRRDPLPTMEAAEHGSDGVLGQPPEPLVDWLRRLVAYHQRNPPPAPTGAWRAVSASTTRAVH